MKYRIRVDRSKNRAMWLEDVVEHFFYATGWLLVRHGDGSTRYLWLKGVTQAAVLPVVETVVVEVAVEPVAPVEDAAPAAPGAA